MTTKERRRAMHTGDLVVLALVGAGLITILLSIIAGLFLTDKSTGLPSWAENVLVAISTACALKLGDVLATLVALATGRQVESFGQQLAGSAPIPVDVPKDAVEAGKQVAEAAVEEADKLASRDPLDLTDEVKP